MLPPAPGESNEIEDLVMKESIEWQRQVKLDLSMMLMLLQRRV